MKVVSIEIGKFSVEFLNGLSSIMVNVANFSKLSFGGIRTLMENSLIMLNDYRMNFSSFMQIYHETKRNQLRDANQPSQIYHQNQLRDANLPSQIYHLNQLSPIFDSNKFIILVIIKCSIKVFFNF